MHRFVLSCLVVAACRTNQPAEIETTAATATTPVPTPTAAAPPAQDTKEQKLARERTWAHQLAVVDRQIEAAKKNAEASPKSALVLDRVAGGYMSRARLTGDYADYAKAEEYLDRAFAIHDTGFGPFMTRAQLNYTLHRLDRVDADVERGAKLENTTAAKIAGVTMFRGKLAFQRGRYAEALQAYEASIAGDESSANLSALAEYRWKTGDFAAAEDLYVRADGRYHAPPTEPHAWNHLMRGLMDLDRGRYDEALVHYRDAASWLDGYWLIDEHIAEVQTLMGNTEEAKALYLDIIARTNNPEFMDAMAGILAQEGKAAEAQDYVARARKRYEELMAKYPEAAYGHALEHYLEFGDDAAFVVDLAEKNHALRPNAEAKVLLVQAYLKAERVPDAKRVIGEALATPWSTADLHATAARVFRAAGDAAKADEELAKAKAIDPHASE